MMYYPALDDVTDFELRDEEERMWMVLYPEDYDDFMFDGKDQIALLLDEEQLREVKRMAENGIEYLTEEEEEDATE